MSFEYNSDSQNVQTGDSFFNEQFKQEARQSRNSEQQSLGLSDLQKKELEQIQKELLLQDEQHKQQVIHTETIGMMTKYQLVFIKLETSMNKINSIFKQRYIRYESYAFDKIANHQIFRKDKLLKRSKLFCLEIQDKFSIFERIIKTYITQNKGFGFQKIQVNSKLQGYQVKFQAEQDKIKKSFLNVITQKESDIQSLNKKNQEIAESVHVQKQKENELNQKLRQLDFTCLQMENDLSLNKRSDTRGSVKLIDQRIRSLEQENQEMQERIMGSEDSVNAFIREMSELLDSHEISTNPDSDENISYDQQILPDYQSQRQYASQQMRQINSQSQKQTKNIQKNFYSNQLARSNRLA